MAEIKSYFQYHDEPFDDIHLNPTSFSSSEFLGCTFTKCSFAESKFDQCRFRDCVFEGSDLSLIQIPGSTFEGTIFNASKVVGVDWTEANWSAYLLGGPLRFKNCLINHSTFIGLKLPGISIIDCTAMEVDFREADLRKANFSGTNFSGSIFGSTNLTEADLRQASNYDINPTKNTISRAKFSLPEAMALLFSMDIELTE